MSNQPQNQWNVYQPPGSPDSSLPAVREPMYSDPRPVEYHPDYPTPMGSPNPAYGQQYNQQAYGQQAYGQSYASPQPPAYGQQGQGYSYASPTPGYGQAVAPQPYGRPGAPYAQTVVVQNVQQQQKSVGVAAVLALFFGPLGMLYSTMKGALVMFLINLVFIWFTGGLILLLTIPAGVIWAITAAQETNRQVASVVTTYH